ncbi:MAG TPA: ABC transporter permease [Candidatus Pelethomonas intestinigallinarum]|nr:ABC transporter permease [Candidatus Pelethomonas intestinigallinarum]
MGKLLYPRLAWQNIKGDRRFFAPYFLALLGNVAAFYIMTALAVDPGMSQLHGAMYVQSFCFMGMFIAAVFSAVFLLYVNGFLMKQRKKALGLYNILGMGKSHIAAVLFFETLFVGGAGIVCGLLTGLLFHKLVTLALYKLLRFAVPFGFAISWDAMARTAILFGVLIGLTLLSNLNKVRVSKPIELLYGGQVGEREPRTKWFMTLLGVLTLGAGYYIALRTTNGMEAIAFYFVAVFLVIIGTYCLFTAVSIFVLKALRANKRFYYKTSHFIGVSGMLYRMKQNAVGLANICILSTMVMVMVSGTLSLYLGTQDIVNRQAPSDLTVLVRYDPDEAEPFDPAAMLRFQEGFIQDQGYSVSEDLIYSSFTFTVGRLPDSSYTTENDLVTLGTAITTIQVLTQDAYAAATGVSLGLEAGEVAFGGEEDVLTIHWGALEGAGSFGRSDLTVAQHLEESLSADAAVSDTSTLVVADTAALMELYENQKEAYGEDSSWMEWQASFSVDATDEELRAVQQAYNQYVRDDAVFAGTGKWWSCGWTLRCDVEADAYGLAGGFLFLGIFLGTIFLMATVLIIYYKQISEGYEDKARFEIMQKVGLSREEVRASIRSQVLMVFFLPIAVAAIHILFDFNMVEKLLTLFQVYNTTLTALCTLGTVLVFFLVYGVVYLLTARTYYKIVER